MRDCQQYTGSRKRKNNSTVVAGAGRCKTLSIIAVIPWPKVNRLELHFVSFDHKSSVNFAQNPLVMLKIEVCLMDIY